MESKTFVILKVDGVICIIERSKRVVEYICLSVSSRIWVAKVIVVCLAHPWLDGFLRKVWDCSGVLSSNVLRIQGDISCN